MIKTKNAPENPERFFVFGLLSAFKGIFSFFNIPENFGIEFFADFIFFEIYDISHDFHDKGDYKHGTLSMSLPPASIASTVPPSILIPEIIRVRLTMPVAIAPPILLIRG